MNANGGFDSGAGGGAGGAGSLNVAGPGLVSTITGATYAKGGIGSQGGSLTAGADNTGNGGDGCRPGGSGVVILKYPVMYTLTITGLTNTTTTAGNFKITTLTAGTGNISF
jgi:hypothetical protein